MDTTADATTLRAIADRIELRDLVQTYAHGADRRRPDIVAGCFLPDGSLYTDLGNGRRGERHGREEIATALKGLERYRVTTHLVANQLVRVDGDTAEGETYCVAHHIYEKDGVDRDKVMSIRYVDAYERTDEGWRIRTRTLNLDSTEDRALGAS